MRLIILDKKHPPFSIFLYTHLNWNTGCLNVGVLGYIGSLHSCCGRHVLQRQIIYLGKINV